MEEDACCVCGVKLDEPDYTVFCEICGNAVCDDCWLEDRHGALYCSNCYHLEVSEEDRADL